MKLSEPRRQLIIERFAFTLLGHLPIAMFDEPVESHLQASCLKNWYPSRGKACKLIVQLECVFVFSLSAYLDRFYRKSCVIFYAMNLYASWLAFLSRVLSCIAVQSPLHPRSSDEASRVAEGQHESISRSVASAIVTQHLLPAPKHLEPSLCRSICLDHLSLPPQELWNARTSPDHLVKATLKTSLDPSVISVSKANSFTPEN